MTAQILKDWSMVKLGEVFKLSSGKFLPKKNLIEGVFPVYGGNGINGYHNECYVVEPTLVIGRVGEYCGAVYITEPNAWITDNALYVTEYLKPVSVPYLKYLLNYMDLNKYAKVAGQPSISQGVIASIQALLPPLEIQHKIVRILDEAYKLRKLRKQADDKMKELIPALFDEIIGDAFANERKWPVRSLEDIASDVQYGTAAKANKNANGIPVLRMNNLTYDGWLDLADLKHINLPSDELDKFTVQYGDLLINRTNSRELVGKTAVWDKEYNYAFAGYLVRFRLNAGLANPFYVSSALNSPSGKRLLFSIAKPAVNMSNISASDMKRIKLAMPPVELQNKFAEQVREVVSHQEVISEARQKLDELFSSLMDRCMSGKF